MSKSPTNQTLVSILRTSEIFLRFVVRHHSYVPVSYDLVSSITLATWGEVSDAYRPVLNVWNEL